jgi:carboxyl-terminal processing protease
VQVKNSQGKVQIERDTEEGVAYDGPLAVLVDGNSASASEIFAGAIQDYKRGVILGEPTFGKGTVQNLVDLNRFDEDSQGKLGQLKATIAQFFRVEGASTQHRGVVPDIAFPTGFSNDHVGERALENALPFAEIPPVQFTPANKVPGNLTLVAKEHSERVQGDAGFQALLAQERALQEARDQKELSLLESKRKQEHDKQRREQRERENQIRIAHGAKPLPEKPAAEEDTAETDDGDDFATRKKDGDKFDVVLEEAGKVLRDVIRVAAPSSLATNAPQH